MGQDMAKDKRWDEAIAYYEKALKESPDSNEYKNALIDAKQESAKVHLDKAKRMLAALPKQESSRNRPSYERGGYRVPVLTTRTARSSLFITK